MSFNHLKYDTCTYRKNLQENVSVLGYIMSPFYWEHEKKCRHELGLVGGPTVSHIRGNIVDLESDLRGQTRYISKCPCNEYHPVAPGGMIVNDKTPPIDTRSLHLPKCQMISYRAIPLPSAEKISPCGY